jgi:ADP-ribose pyrophosphatase YjhB (NUDIX family)
VYCFNCGTALATGPPTVCSSCGIRHWNNAKPTGIAVVHYRDRILLARRNFEPWKEHWDFPGGYCSDREHPIATAERKVLEKTGLVVKVTAYLGTWYERHDTPWVRGGGNTTTLGHFYVAEPVGGTDPVARREVSDAKWFRPDAIPFDLAFPEQQLPALAAFNELMQQEASVFSLPDRPR